MAKRECGTCTKCCEGWLEGEALGHTFGKGIPCPIVTIGKGCNSYALRPKEPCVNYKCGWLANKEIPEWLKPSEINAIINYAVTDGIHFIRIIEAGEVLSSKVLTSLLLYALSKQANLAWSVNGELSWIGTPEFNQMMLNQEFPTNKLPHSKPILLPVVEVNKKHL
jgi:hypothetical protein